MFKKPLTSLLLVLIGVGGFFWIWMEFKKDIWTHTTFITQIWISQSYAVEPCSTEEECALLAKTIPSTGTQNAEIQKMLNTLVAGVNIVLSILTIIVSPAIMLASWLMSPDWTAGEIFGLRPVLHDLWITVSNITYFIYAILLIIIALATIFNSEHYGYKAMLPKLALGIIMVPLTWWAVQFTISLATYVTAVAISVPAEAVAKFTQEDSWWEKDTIPTKISYRNNSYYSDSVNLSKDNNMEILCKNGLSCTSPSKITANTSGLFSPLMIYSFWVFKIQNVKLLTTDPLYPIKWIIQIVHQWIIGAIMFIIYGLLVLALIFVLLMRAMKLWMYAMFSPLFTIKYVLWEKAFWDADKDGSFTITEFIGLAFVPAVISLALSFWLIVIAALQSPLSWNGAVNENNKCEGEICTIKIGEKDLIQSRKTADGKWTETVISFGWLSYTFEGSVEWGEKVMPWINSALSATWNIFWTIILDIIALVFVWIAFMAGKSVSKAASKAIEPFENMGKKIGELGMSLPKYAPIPGTGGLSMKWMDSLAWDLKSNIESSWIKKAQDSKLGQMIGANKYANGDTKVKAREISKDSSLWKFEELKWLIHRDEIQGKKADTERVQLLNALLGMADATRNDMINRLGFTDGAKLKENMVEMAKNKVEYKEHDPKFEKAKWWMGSWTAAGWSGTGSNPAWYTLKKREGDITQLLIVLWSNTIDVGTTFKWKNVKEITDVIIKEVKAKNTEFEKNPIDWDALEQLLNSDWLPGKEIVAGVRMGLDSKLMKKKSEAPK